MGTLLEMPLPLGIGSGGKHSLSILGGVGMAEIIYYQCEKCGLTFKSSNPGHKMGNITIQLTGYSIHKSENTAQCICNKCQEEYRVMTISAFEDFFNK